MSPKAALHHGTTATSVARGTRLRRNPDGSAPLNYRFVATLAHELRQPLGSIVSALDVLRRHISADSDEHARRVAERQVTYLARLLDDLLDIARIREGKIRLRTERVDLRLIVHEAVESVHPLVAGRNHQLVIAQPEYHVWVEADRDRLHQVLSNLLQNAAKYTEPGGTIWLDVARDPEGITISVRDTGRGMPREMLERVFTRFTQVGGGDTGGLGIGLQVVRGLVELHGGTVEARSAGLNRGSEFVVKLPAR